MEFFKKEEKKRREEEEDEGGKEGWGRGRGKGIRIHSRIHTFSTDFGDGTSLSLLIVLPFSVSLKQKRWKRLLTLQKEFMVGLTKLFMS